MSAQKTIRELLATTVPWLQKKGCDEARLDAELMFAHALKLRRLDLYLDLDRPLTPAELDACRALVVRRGAREPVAYILGEREFFGLKFIVSPAVLIPRADSETLVEEALKRLPIDATGTVVDVCTGSGCIGLAIAHARPQLTVVLSDISAEAVAVAEANAKRLGLDARVRCVTGDLLSAVDVEQHSVLAIVANPPYIHPNETQDLAVEVKDHEPHLALFGRGDDALLHHTQLLTAARALLAPDGFCGLEIGHAQGDAGARIARELGYEAVVVKDLGQRDRVVIASSPR